MNRIYTKIAAAIASVVSFIGPSFAQTPVTLSSWGAPVTLMGAGKPNGPVMLDANGQIPTVNLSSALANYVTNSVFSTTIASYLKSSDAASTYLTQTSAASSYLTQAKAASTYLPLSGGSITGNVVLSGYVRILSGGYLWLTNPTQDANNQNIYISFDSSDNSLYFTNRGAQASNYLTSKFNAIKATSLTGTGNAYACVNSAGQFYRSASACQ